MGLAQKIIKTQTETEKENISEEYQPREQCYSEKSVVERQNFSNVTCKPEKGYCRACGKKSALEEIEIHDGFCVQCWYQNLQSEVAKEMRRSGLYGADRAGTW